MRLKVQIDHCDYEKEGWPEAGKIEMIRDKFVFGIHDDYLKERLLRESDILLNKLVGLAQQTESLKQHIREMTGASRKSMDAIHKNKEQTEFLCGQCGYKYRPKECPAFGQQCARCQKLHHLAKVCHSKCQIISQSKQTAKSKSTAQKEFMSLIRNTAFQ